MADDTFLETVMPILGDHMGALVATALIAYYEEARRQLQEPHDPEKLRQVIALAVATGRYVMASWKLKETK